MNYQKTTLFVNSETIALVHLTSFMKNVNLLQT